MHRHGSWIKIHEQEFEVKDQIMRGFTALTIHKMIRSSKKTQENEEE